MSLCQICREKAATISVCEADPSHKLDADCLQEMITAAGSDIALFRCPVCNTFVKPSKIFSFQTYNIKISQIGLKELTAAMGRVTLMKSLDSSRKFA